jgi:Acetyltransferase (GNAT) domain
LRVERYTAAREREWNDFVCSSKNGTFLFDRGYMDYHRDRFVDSSLMVHDDRGRLIALLPASRHERVLVSHGGLTYGGFISGARMTTTRMLEVADSSFEHLRDDGIERVIYKCVPHIYHSLPAEEDAYALFARDAALVRRDVSSAIDTRLPAPPQNRRRRVLERARRAGLHVERVDGFHLFWPVLERNLAERYGKEPVHTRDEITYLAQRFPENILLLVCTAGEDVLAGAVLYVSRNVCHVQYNATSAEGRRLGALDLVLAAVIERFSPTHRVIDFGISTERDGRHLNEGLIDYKEGFGARAVNYDFYELRLSRDG